MDNQKEQSEEGIASFACALIGILLTLVEFYILAPFALLAGIVLGILASRKENEKKTLGILGLIISIVASIFLCRGVLQIVSHLYQ